MPLQVFFPMGIDKTLKDMAAKVPQSATEFRQVHGVGEVKAESYGPIFLRAITEWEGQKG